jgi:ABC-type lipoprotein release transport system permease subunit
MILRLAFKNIIHNGYRSLVNIVVVSIVLIIMVWTQAMYYSWIRLAENQQKYWEYGKGMLRVKTYDPYDPLSYEDSHAPIPEELRSGVEQGDLLPVLLAPATIYPQGRMLSAIIKGIPAEQDILVFPSDKLSAQQSDIIPVLIGSAMAKSTRLDQGDIFSIRVRDVNGAYNAVDAIVQEVLPIPAPSADMGTIWMNLDLMRDLRGAPHSASYFVLGDSRYQDTHTRDFRFIDRDEYFADLDQMLDNERFQQVLMYALLVFLAMIAIFDTQALAVFKRRKEIGTLAALGFTKAKIILLFTLEGSIYTLLAIIATPILGFPLFYYFSTAGFPVIDGYDEFGLPGFTEPIKFIYPIYEILIVFLVILLFTIFVSWLPTRKIAKMNPVDALRNKVD